MPVGHLYILFGEIALKICAHVLVRLFYFWLIWTSSLYILDINPPFSDIVLFTDVFSHSVAGLSFCWFCPLTHKRFKVWCSLVSLCLCCYRLFFWRHIQEIIAMSNVMQFFLFLFFLRVLGLSVLAKISNTMLGEKKSGKSTYLSLFMISREKLSVFHPWVWW